MNVDLIIFNRREEFTDLFLVVHNKSETLALHGAYLDGEPTTSQEELLTQLSNAENWRATPNYILGHSLRSNLSVEAETLPKGVVVVNVIVCGV